jgi:hypothetical protein
MRQESLPWQINVGSAFTDASRDNQNVRSFYSWSGNKELVLEIEFIDGSKVLLTCDFGQKKIFCRI